MVSGDAPRSGGGACTSRPNRCERTSEPLTPTKKTETHVQLVVEALDLDDQAVLARHQLVLQLSHLGLVGWLSQVVAQNVDQQVEEDDTVRRKKRSRMRKRMTERQRGG